MCIIWLLLYIGKVRVKCNQTGKLQCESHSSKDGDPLQRDDLVAGAQLIMTLNKRSYPVTLQKITSPLEPQTVSYF